MKINSGEKDFSELRKKAEGKLFKETKSLHKGSPADLEHELTVHKIELEMQNEELLATQQQLLKSNEEYAELFDYAPISYFILDKDGMIIRANETGGKQLGIETSSLKGKSFSAFIDSETEQDHYYRYRNLLFESEKSQQVECKIKRGNGSTFFALIETIPVKSGDSRFKHFLSTVIDISHQKEQEGKIREALIREKELGEMKLQFITTAMHEFGTPLAGILSSADLIQRYSDPKDEEKRNKHFLRIKSSVLRLKNILTDFLSMDYIEHGVIVNNPEAFDLSAFISEFIGEIRTFNASTEIVYKQARKKIPVHLDKKLMGICFMNLVGNAIKFSHLGGEVEIAVKKTAAGKLVITIKDFGIGIPEDDQPQIFQEFFRAKNVETIQGIGLGLSMTKKMVQLMGGSISFESMEHKGTVFLIQFPQAL